MIAEVAWVLSGLRSRHPNFKPGLDFYDDGSGDHGQARMLQDFAAAHNVTMVAISIGGNNYNFGSIVADCVADFLSSPSWWPHYCHTDSPVTSNFTSSNIAAQTNAITGAIQNIHTAMANDGYRDSQYTILVQDYPSPLPNGSGFRYSESGYTRQSTGVSNLVTMELSSTFNGRRLCENTVGLLEEEGLSYWTDAGAVDVTEWINQIRTTSTFGSDYYIQESLHPNY